MAGKEFTISNIVDSNDIEKLKKLRAEFDANDESVKNLTLSLAKLTKINPANFDELRKKQDAANSAMSQLYKSQERQIALYEKQAIIIENVSKKLQDFARLSNLSRSMDSFTQSVNKANEALSRISESTEKVKMSQDQGAQSAQNFSNSFHQATSNIGIASGEYAKIIQSVTAFNNDAGQLNKRLIENKIALSNVQRELKLYKKDLDANIISKSDYANKTSELTIRERELTQQQRQYTALLNNHASVIISTAGSYNEMSSAVLQLEKRYKDLSQAQRGGVAGTEMLSQIERLRNELKSIDATMGNYQRNVGNYRSAFNGLGMSMQQVARELPNLAMGAKTFILAISNNIPILADEIGRARAEYSRLVESGQKATPVWKQVVGSIFSWQTALVAGITVLTLYGKEIGNFIKELFNGKEAFNVMAESSKQINEAMKEGTKNAAKEVGMLKILYNATQNVNKPMNERLAAVNELQRKYPNYFKNLKEEDILAGNAADSYKKLRDNIIESAQAKAISDKIAENSGKRFDLELKREDPINSLYVAEKELRRLKSEGVEASLQEAIVIRFKNELESIDAEIEAIDELNNKLSSYIDVSKLVNDQQKETIKSNESDGDSYSNYMTRIENELAEAHASIIEQSRKNEIEAIKAEYKKKESAIRGNSEKEQELRIAYTEAMNKEIADINYKYGSQIAKSNLQNKLAFVKDGTDEELKLRLELLELQRKEEVREADQTGSEILAVDMKYAKLRAELIEDNASKSVEIIARELERSETIRNNQFLKEQAILSDQYAKGLIKKEKYERESLKLEQKYAVESSKATIESLNSQIAQLELFLENSSDLTEEEIENFKANIEKLKGEIGEITVDINVKIGESSGSKGGMPEYMQSISDWLEDNEKEVEQAMELYNSLFELTDALFERKIERIEEEQEANQAAYDEDVARIERLEEIGAISKEEAEARKRAAADKTAAKEKELEKKKAELQTRRAKFEKANSIIQTITNTAMSIIKTGAELGFPAAIPFIALAAATGAIQLATIIAQPIPKYAKGTKSHKGGFAVVGDGGQQETAILPSGKKWITPAIPTLVDLPKGTQVIPKFEPFDLVNIDEMKKYVKSDAMLMMEYAERNSDIPIVNVNFDSAALQLEMRRGFGELAKLYKQSMGESKRNAEYAAFRNKVNNRTKM
jgi:hypothetical protein